MNKIHTRNSLHEITEVMISHGGGFVSQLGRLFRLADRDNTNKLAETFRDYIVQYDELAVKIAEQRQESAPSAARPKEPE